MCLPFFYFIFLIWRRSIINLHISYEFIQRLRMFPKSGMVALIWCRNCGTSVYKYGRNRSKSFEIVKKQTTFYTSEHFLAHFFQAFSNNFIYDRALDSLSLRSLHGQVCLVIYFRLKMNTSIKFETKEEHESWMIKVEQFMLAFLKALT